ncbi:MAG: hypothetical protein K0Q99_1699 [Clostridia bacterium]|jgi:hypothetical protein|nr:hypothetical protein [Clostridia bacterium]
MKELFPPLPITPGGKMKKKHFITIFIVAVIFLTLWFSDFLPKQIVKVVAGNYISNQVDGVDYKLKDVEYSPAHDCYFAYYVNEKEPNARTRNIGVYYRWFPVSVYFDSAYPG